MLPNASSTPESSLDYRLIAAASVLLSIWLIAIDPIISRDAIIYLRGAEAYLQDGLFASQQLFGRPFLSLCIATVHQVTGLPLLYAGLLVNTLFYAVLCVGFVATVRTLGGDRRVQILAAIVILSHPLLANYRSSIMRDPAYWAFIILAFRELLLFARNPVLRHQAGWLVCILLAAQFRFEGLFFAILSPVALLFIKGRQFRVRDCLRLLLPQLAAFAALVAAALVYQQVIQPGSQLFPDIQTYVDSLTGISQQFSELSSKTGEALLSFSAKQDATVATIAGLVAILLLNICRAISWPWLVTLLWGWWRGRPGRMQQADITLLNAHLLISLLYLALFTLLNQFMLERYSGIFALFALFYLPFVLDNLWQGTAGTAGKVAVFVLLAVMTADTLHNHNYQKFFIRDAANWIEENTPPQASLITNDRYVAYFSRRQVEWRRGKPKNHKFDVATLAAQPALWRDVDYLAVAVKRGQASEWQAFLTRYSMQELAVFGGGRRGTLSIVAVP